MRVDSNHLHLVLCFWTLFVSVTLADRRSYGEECNRTQRCDKTAWLSCRGGKCDCYKSDEMLYDEENGKCVTKSGERCKYGADSEEILVEITDCVANSICSADGVCQCDSKYHETYNGTCGLSVLFGENCSDEDQCSKFVGLRCVDAKCECKDGVYSREKGLCVGRSQGSCLRNECVKGAICVQGKCLCDSDHFHSSEKTCLPKKKIFQNCNRDAECLQKDNLNLRCISGICNCPHNFEYSFVQKYEYSVHNRYGTVGGYKPFAIGFTGPFVEMCAPRIGEKCPNGYCTDNVFCDAEAQEWNTEPTYGSCRCINEDLQNCARLYDQDCIDDSDCIDDLVCSTGKCDCPSPMFQFFDASAKICVTKVGGHCTDISTCVPNSNCVYLTSARRSGHCRCDPNSVVNRDRYCDLVYGEDCVKGDVQCDTTAGLLCINKKCSCPDKMYEYNARFRKCLGLVGAPCRKSEENIVCDRNLNDDSSDYCYATSQSKLVCIENAYCKEKSPLLECDCVNGYVETDNHTCVPITEIELLCDAETNNCSAGINEEHNSTQAQEISYDGSACDLHTCKNGQCILNEWVCDGIVQCDDSSDEMNCPSTARHTNSSYTNENGDGCDASIQWRCRNGQCIPRSNFCDQYSECDDGSDEPQQCQETGCGDDFKCFTHGDGCVRRYRVCDGIKDCKDGSDETICVISVTKMSNVPSDQPPPYNQINNQHIQGPPIIQPAITNQPIILQPPRQQQQQQQVVNTIQIVHTGNHCTCRHSFRSEFTCCGICFAIFLFPVGLICCFCMRKQRCRHCNLYA